MILVDTSVWIDHLTAGKGPLRELLAQNDLMVHPFVIGEIACGHLGNRQEVLRLLEKLPKATMADYREVLSFIETQHLFGSGIGWVDANLVVSALLSHVKLLTHDKRLRRLVMSLGLGPES